jgi:hypothetical protein
MRSSDRYRHVVALAASVATVSLVSCGGGGGDTPPPATELTGVAAHGGPLAGATITVIDSSASTTDPAPVTAGADGRYTIDVSGLQAPLVVKAVGSVEGETVTTLAVVPAVTANAANTANVTPLTNAVAALIAPNGDPQALLTPATLASAATSQNVSNASALLVNTLSTDPAIASALGANFDPVATPFTANGSGPDGVIDKLAVDVSSAGVAITNLAAPVASGEVPQAVVLTAAQTATPNVVPTLPASAPASDVPTDAEIAALGAKVQSCLALPVAQRVTMDGTGTVTAVSDTCKFGVSDFKSDGRTFVQGIGQYTLAKSQFTGTTVGKGLIQLTLAAPNVTDPKTATNPYCNTATCVVVRYPWTTASGQLLSSDWLLAKANGAWSFVGNQRPYRAFAEPRLNRKTAMNRTGAATTNYFQKDRFESQLRLTFDLTVGNTSNIRAVRFTGPGLPAAGVVMYRSQRCGSDDRMVITSQDGSTRTNDTNQFQFWTGGGGADFTLDAANFDGTPLAMPVPVRNTTTNVNPDFSPAPVANQSATIPAWSLYKIEIFHFDVLSDTPDEIMYARINSPAENATLGASKAWPTLDTQFGTDWLTPTGAKAGGASSFAQTMAWTAPSGTYVGSSYIFSQNFLTTANSQGETANYGRRSRIDMEPAAYGDSTGSGYQFASGVAGTSMSSFTANSGSNPNPRCTANDLVPLTTTAGDYREAGLTFRGLDRKQYNAIWFWSN